MNTPLLETQELLLRAGARTPSDPLRNSGMSAASEWKAAVFGTFSSSNNAVALTKGIDPNRFCIG